MPLFALMGFSLLSGVPAVAGAPTIPAPILPSYTVTLTGYNAVASQTDSEPLETASGLYANPETIAARSKDLAAELPFGTIVEISATSTPDDTCGYHVVAPVVGYRIIADTMNARYAKRIDILFNTKSNYALANGSVKNASTILGVCSGMTVRVVGRLDLAKDTLPQTQADLAALVQGEHDLALR